MLTSLFYYEHYRPYIMKNSGLKDRKSGDLGDRRLLAENGGTPAEVALNKALNKDVVNYAKGIYRNTTELKHTSKKLSSDLRNYARYRERDEFDRSSFEKGFNRDLELFASSYNKSVSFLKNQPHSRYLGEVADKLEEMADASGKILAVMGLERDERNELAADREKSTFWNGRNTGRKLKAAEDFFASMYNETSGILDNPMSQHMNFKSLNYYYNYDVDKIKVDSFQIIKTGLLVNLAL